MEKGAISDGQISASSQLDANHEASQGRLNLKGSWSAYANDAKQWLQGCLLLSQGWQRKEVISRASG